MQLYNIKNNKLLPIREKRIDLERNIQNLSEDNLDTIFGLEFISTEFSLQNFRIDTLAFNKEANSFIIIEYKKDKNFSVIDQGFSYLSLLLNNKSDFILEYNEKKGHTIKRDEIDWEQSKVIFVSPLFTTYQQNSINFKDIPIELWEIKLYENSYISFNQIKIAGSVESINKIAGINKEIKEVSKEIKVYTTEDHVKKDWPISRELYEEFSQKVLNIDPQITIKPVKSYIGFGINNKLLLQLRLRSNKLAVDLLRIEPKDVKDPEKRLIYQKNSMKYYNKHVSQIYIENSDDIDYVIPIIKEIYKKYFLGSII